MNINDYIAKIKKLNACGESLKDALNYKTSQELWDKCERGDWMIWLIGKLSCGSGSEKRKQLVLTACECARLALEHVPEGENRPLNAIEIAEKWARNEASIEDVIAASAAAYAAAATAYAAASAAAYAAAAAAYAAASAAAAYAAADAAAAYNYARNDTLAKCAEIIRKNYPNIDNLFEELDK